LRALDDPAGEPLALEPLHAGSLHLKRHLLELGDVQLDPLLL
jgi:hypothetical protein